jgi:hypothetical protein
MSNQSAQGQPKRAVDVCRHVQLSDEARKYLFEEQTAPQFLSLLIKNGLYEDALRFVAYDLGKREAVWWGCLCLWEAYRPSPPPTIDAALQAVVAWVQQPEEPQRREADAAGKAAGVNTPAGMLAEAVYCSGGSISLPDLPEVEPDEWLTAQMVAAAVVLASKSKGPEQKVALQRRFLVVAGEVTGVRLRWHLDDSERKTPVASS